MSSKRIFYTDVVETARDKLAVSMARAWVAKGAAQRADPKRATACYMRAIRQLLPSAMRDKDRHVSVARAINRDIVANKRVLARITEGSK